MRFACWINKAIDTDSEYVILITFPRQQRLGERTSALRYVYIAYLVCTVSIVYMFLMNLYFFESCSACFLGKKST